MTLREPAGRERRRGNSAESTVRARAGDGAGGNTSGTVRGFCCPRLRCPAYGKPPRHAAGRRECVPSGIFFYPTLPHGRIRLHEASGIQEHPKYNPFPMVREHPQTRDHPRVREYPKESGNVQRKKGVKIP